VININQAKEYINDLEINLAEKENLVEILNQNSLRLAQNFEIVSI
jgi:hypothetical protein